MPQVAREIVEPRQASLIAHRVHGLTNAAGVEPRGPLRLLRRAATAPHILAGQRQVRLELVLQLAIAWIPPERSPEAPNPFEERSH